MAARDEETKSSPCSPMGKRKEQTTVIIWKPSKRRV
jgi:hypothetical protein